MADRSPWILDLAEVNLQMIDTVGGKNASLGEMIQNLDGRGINVPGGFVITVDAYKKFIQHNELEDKINAGDS